MNRRAAPGLIPDSALFAVAVASARAGLGGAALACDKMADAGAWAQPNVPGMPGYKAPPKGPDEPKGAIPAPSPDASSASYLQRMTGGSGKK